MNLTKQLNDVDHDDEVERDIIRRYGPFRFDAKQKIESIKRLEESYRQFQAANKPKQTNSVSSYTFTNPLLIIITIIVRNSFTQFLYCNY